MASKNKLLGSGKVEEVEEKVVEVGLLEQPILLHHAKLPCTVVKTKEKLAELLSKGWADHPGKVRILPGWEKLFEGKIEKEKVKEVTTAGSIFESET